MTKRNYTRKQILATRLERTKRIVAATSADGVIDRTKLFSPSPRTGNIHKLYLRKQARINLLKAQQNQSPQRKLKEERINKGYAFIGAFMSRYTLTNNLTF